MPAVPSEIRSLHFPGLYVFQAILSQSALIFNIINFIGEKTAPVESLRR
jgi:hypothetical protein